MPTATLRTDGRGHDVVGLGRPLAPLAGSMLQRFSLVRRVNEVSRVSTLTNADNAKKTEKSVCRNRAALFGPVYRVHVLQGLVFSSVPFELSDAVDDIIIVIIADVHVLIKTVVQQIGVFACVLVESTQHLECFEILVAEE